MIILKKYTNPIIPTSTNGHTADPYVIKYNGMYYHCYKLRDGVYLSKSKELCDIGTGERMCVYKAPEKGNDSLWFAPELHHINGAWYIYGAPITDETTDMHTMCVLENKSDDPMSPYTNLGMIHGLENTWCIDATILHHDNKLWMIWTTCAEMYISEMENPWTIKGKITALTHPEYEFETKQGIVNEGPAILKRDNKIHVVYSANDSKTDDYCLGLLTYNGGDILDIANWEKSKKALFEKTDDIYGPGHCSFTTAEESGETVDYIVYHANLESGSGWTGRSVWIQKFTWDDDGYPVFGKPHV